MCMKATFVIGSAIVLVSFPSAAANHGKHEHARHPRTPTAMHTTRVHHHVEIAPPTRHIELDAGPTHPQAHGAPAKVEAKPAKPCLHEPVTVARGVEEDHVALTRCDGSATPDAVDHVSVLARAESVVRPTARGVLPAGMRRIDARLVERLQQVADHFGHTGHPVSIHIVSGFRPNSAGSFHSTAQALDFRVDGVRNEDLVAFCKTMDDTGCGYYPNSSFVHLDVRAPGTGHVSWIDASGPGEAPHYVSAWPPPPDAHAHAADEDFAARLERILPPIPVDEHPANVRSLIENRIEASLRDEPRRVH